jgi:hypothetical protein
MKWEDTMTGSEQPTVEKKTYKKPEFTEVRLVAQEAVLGACKYADGILSMCTPDLICENSEAAS